MNWTEVAKEAYQVWREIIDPYGEFIDRYPEWDRLSLVEQAAWVGAVQRAVDVESKPYPSSDDIPF